jgi:hypothetical protein
MTISAPGALAVELHPHSPTHWAATYYPMVHTSAGRWADVTWVLHRSLIPASVERSEPARWLELHSPDPAHPCYAEHRAWSETLAAGYVAAWAAHDAEAVEGSLSARDARLLRENAVVIPAGQLPEWVLDDVRHKISPVST